MTATYETILTCGAYTWLWSSETHRLIRSNGHWCEDFGFSSTYAHAVAAARSWADE